MVGLRAHATADSKAHRHCRRLFCRGRLVHSVENTLEYALPHCPTAAHDSITAAECLALLVGSSGSIATALVEHSRRTHVSVAAYTNSGGVPAILHRYSAYVEQCGTSRSECLPQSTAVLDGLLVPRSRRIVVAHQLHRLLRADDAHRHEPALTSAVQCAARLVAPHSTIVSNQSRS